MTQLKTWGVGGIALSVLALNYGCSGPIGESADADGGVVQSELEMSHSSADTASSADDADLIQTPGGKLHKSCVYEVPGDSLGEEGGTIKKDGRTLRKIERCAHPLPPTDRRSAATATAPTVNGWIEDVNSTVPVNGMGFDWATEISADWKVPAVPSQSGATVYLFDGFQDAQSQVIIQPVLQYGQGGVNKWQLASWYGGSLFGGNYFHSTPIDVSVGDTISGFTVGRNCNSGGACRWQISSVDRTKNTSTAIFVDLSVSMKWAVPAVLEAYNVASCSQLPSGTGGISSFTNVALFQPWNAFSDLHQTTFNGACTSASAPCWSKAVASVSPSCGYSVSATSTSATLRY